MALAIFDSPSTGIARSVQVPADLYRNLSASSAVGLFVAGAVPYVVYVPSSAALAAFGWTGLPFRVVVYWGTGTSGFTDGGTNTTPATNVGQQCTDNSTNLGAKLGYGTANNGSLAAPIQTWPTLVVFIQLPVSWVPATNLAGATHMIHDAVMADVFKNYNCDPRYVYATGMSLGATNLEYYLIAQSYWPTRFPVRYAAAITIAAAPSGSGSRQTWPEAVPGENSTNQTFPRLAARIARVMQLPWIKVNSTGDTTNTPISYNPLVLPIKANWPNNGIPIIAGTSGGTQSFHGKYFSFYEYQGGSAPNHAPMPDFFYGSNNVVSNGPGGRTLTPTDPWVTWLFSQSLKKQATRFASNPYGFLNFAGAPAPAPGGSTIDRESRRRRTVGGGRDR